MTRRQYETLNFIRAFILEHGYSPTFKEIADAIGVASKSNVSRYVWGLVRLGEIVILQMRHRAIRLPDNHLATVTRETLQAELNRRGTQ
jgi:repressor LexA